MADVLSVFAFVFCLTIAMCKLRAFNYRGSVLPPKGIEMLLAQTVRWCTSCDPLKVLYELPKLPFSKTLEGEVSDFN